MKKPFLKTFPPSISAVAAAALVIGGTAFAVTSGGLNGESRTPLNLKFDDTPIHRDGENSFAPVVEKVAPGVVRIVVTAKAARQMSAPELDFFRRFFGPNGPSMPGQGGGSELMRGLGSGVIVSGDGYILTNNHVVQNATDLQVTLNDGRQFTAKVVGSDPRTDVALIKIRAENLPALTLADSDKVQIGDVVLAIGNPFGIGQTVTHGIVSAKNRATSGEMDEDFIQTDAAINPGNSGGALVDAEGRLIGVNSEILTHSGGNQGIGFAVPSDLCRWVMDGLIKNGRIERGFMGVAIQNLTPDLAKAFKIDRPNGALVSDVTPGSPAEAAGIKSGDVIIGVNNQPVSDAGQLKLKVAETAPGSKIPVQIDRGGQNMSIDLTLGHLPNEKTAQNGPSDSNRKEALAGVGVADLDQNTRTQLNIPSNVKGAVVTQVAEDSPAYAVGLREGNVIEEINHQPVRSAEDAVKLTSKPSGDQTLVKFWSNEGGSHYVTVEESNNEG